ncbi:MAG: phytoene synthase [Zetaproteobacteria bacterium]|nr:phytoene synthase [Pseudobdellovibrionaceae bacterium]
MSFTVLSAHVVEEARLTMKKGSLSFFLACQLLKEKARVAIYFLYAWCRFSDDVIDQDVSGLEDLDLEKRLTLLRQDTVGAFEQKPQPLALKKIAGSTLAFKGMALLNQSYQLPSIYPSELLEGMKMDAEGYTYHTYADLDLYCYRVAGVVGLMSCHVLGITDHEALAHADALGRGMQLTNIARDIKEDGENGRIYVPREWWDEFGLTKDDFLEHQRPELIAKVAKKLIDRANPLYREGEKGLRYLNFRCAFAVASARYIYAEIGHEVVRRGAKAWDQRTWIPLPRKLVLVGKAFLLTLKTIPWRLKNGSGSIMINQYRHYQLGR